MIPSYNEFYRPMLDAIADGGVHTLKELYVILADYFGLTELERRQLQPEGRQILYKNRICWAKMYLDRAGLLMTPKRGTVVITAEGKRVQRDEKIPLDNDYLMRYESFREFKNK